MITRRLRDVTIGRVASSQGLPVPVVAYVGWWVGSGLAAIGLLAAFAGGERPHLLWVLALVGVIAATDSVELVVQHEKGGEAVNLVEIGVVLAILVLPPPWAATTVALGLVASQGAVYRRSALKVAFNAAQHTVAAAATSLIVAPLRGTDAVLTAESLFRLTLALAIYACVSGIAMAGLFRRLGEGGGFRLFFSRTRFIGVTVFGSGVVGIIAYILLRTNPLAVPLLISPIVALNLAYRGVSRTQTLLAEVRHERDRLDRIVAGASEGIVLLDGDGRIVVWNPAMEAITGYSGDEVVGLPAAEVLIGRTAEGTPIDAQMPIATGDSHVVEATIAGANATSASVRMIHTVIRDEDDDPVGDVIVVRDLGRERAATNLKEDFVARVSHELRTPLSPIRGYAQVLLRAEGRIDADKQRQMFEQIVERTTHLEALIDDLLLVSRISSGRIEDLDEVRPETVDVDRLVGRLVEWFERDHPERAFTLSSDEVPHVVWGDPTRIGQIVTNLLSNACKYSPPGTAIEIGVTTDGTGHRVAVTDHGSGIPSDQLDLVFERFQRLDDPQRMRTSGIGLGLYISRHLAQRMDGDVTVTSDVGLGSTFTLRLPSSDEDAAPVVSRSKVRRRPADVPHPASRQRAAAGAVD